MSNEQTRWFLVSNCGMNFPLHQTMISLGKEGCDIVLQSRSVDKRHALVTFDHYEKRFRVKDLSSINGTYLNEVRIPSQTFIKLEHLDTLRFGFDVTVYQIQQVIETFPVPAVLDYRSYGWKVAPYPRRSTKMSECQGCLQKQTVRHTCGSKDNEWVAANPSPAEESRPRPQEFIRPLPNLRNSQLCARMPIDPCGNFFPRADPVSSENDLPRHGQGGFPTQAAAISQRLAAHERPAAENENSIFSGSEVNFGQRPYSLPRGQPRSPSSHPRSCAFSTPSEATHRSNSAAPSPSVENLRPAASRNAGCSANSSLQSTFSGDSLDVTLEDDAVRSKGKNVVEAEKPLDSSSLPAGQRPVCTAFTIEFDDDPSTAKKLDIKDSISKFAPPKADCETKFGHRRNVLESFSDENGNCSGERSDCPIEVPKSGIREAEGREGKTSPTLRIVSAAKEKLVKSEARRGGYHSDGHASSDQEGTDDLSAKSDPERRRFELDKDCFEVVGLSVKLAERKTEGSSPRPNGTLGHRSLRASDLKDSAKRLVRKMFGEITAPTNSPTEPIPPAVPSSSSSRGEKGKSLRDELPSPSPSVSKRSEGAKIASSGERENDEQVQELAFSDEEEDSTYDPEATKVGGGLPPREGDDVSEAGTYTVESDRKEAEEEARARKNIDSVFGVAFKRPVVEGEEKEDRGRKNVDFAPNGGSNNGLKDKGAPAWLKEWVARSALESGNDAPASAAPIDLSDVNARLLHSMRVGSKDGANEPVARRQRRRLPVPPVDRAQLALPVESEPRPTLSSAANEKLRAASSGSSTSPDGRRSDSSMDTETILKETENVVSAMEARMDYRQQRGHSGEGEDCKDSGGESDVDTSTASGINEAASCGTYDKRSRQSKSLENDDLRGDRTYGKSRALRECHGGRNEFGGNYSEGETASVHSDVSSSSEVSGSSPVSGRKRASDKAPLMRFNRAFSLRRARLDCDSDGTGKRSTSSCAKTGAATPAASRPSSAGSVGSSKEGPRRGSASNRSDGVATAPNAAGGGSFERSDGGRFSLRLPKSAPVVGRAARGKTVPTGPTGGGKGKGGAGGKSAPAPRSYSTLSSKELEMKNWKRRKEYDPLKAAAEGRRKDSAATKSKTSTTATSKSEAHSPISTPFARSVSFHGTEGLARLRRDTFTSEDEVVSEATARRGHPALPTDAFGPIYDLGLKGRTKKSSEDEFAYEATRAYETVPASSPRAGSPLLHPVHRHKSKIDALDNLVISTINQVSSNLRGKTEDILKKLGGLHRREFARCFGAEGLTDLLESLTNGDSPDLSPQGSSVSRQLSGILKNMKRLEESLQAIHKVLDSAILADDGGPAKINGNSRHGEDAAPPHRAALDGNAKKKPNGRHVRAAF